MAFQRDPNEIGTLWLDRTKDGTGFRVSGKAFPVPTSGITVDLIPFSYTKEGEEKRGLRVVKVATHGQGEHVPGWDEVKG